MKIFFTLIVGRRGSLRVVKTSSRLSTDELAVGMSLEVPDKLFSRPQLKADVVIPESVALKNPIDAQVINNVEDAIQTVTGLNFKVSIEKPESEDENA